MRRTLVLVAMFAAAAANAACGDLLSNLLNKTNPSATTTTTSAQTSLEGSWATAQSSPGASGSFNDACVDFKWTVTEFSGSAGAGTFSATCMGNVKVVGSARAELTSSTTANWTATATGTAPASPSCGVSLSGTATLEATNQIKIPYSGTSCIGPLSGTEVIKR
jgi:hypothetical protein